MMDARKTDPGNEEDLKLSVMEHLDTLDADDKRKVLNFSRERAASTRSRTRGGSLLAFAGLIPKDDLVEMMRTIEEGCESVDEKER